MRARGHHGVHRAGAVAVGPRRVRGVHRAPGAHPRRRDAAVLAALVVTAGVTWQQTAGAFSRTTSNTGNSMALATVSISDNDAGAALFTVSGILPGQTGTACLVVTYSGSATSTVKLYTANYNATDGAADGVTAPSYLRMLVQVGTGTCASPVGLTNVTAASPGDTMTTVSGKTNFANGYGTGWTSATAGNTRVFRFTYTLDAATPTTAQSDGITTDFVWEAQNN
ncbi:hypothetical protein GCM10010123_25210 [Pilimelia anulata]|uniref:Uncharacterized protein n=1 Tax=Pilimelia anulata TaxID=53371 RepID=A0A8J3F9M4_9ACTN|nr:hypothetical protein [Pilimelia anulata]GGJ94323.1 hypothetical protein GCM10010123_25210 [Pilimelia anulata]